VLALGCGVARGQSHDPKNPTPLAPGVNKGNIDNFGGPHYYYFYAGPGHFEVQLGFHEMGIFGNPLRQNLAFDFTGPDGKNVAHMLVTSQGSLATLSNHGDYTDRKRLLMTVTAQQGTVRLGGYYEFSATGAVSFDGKPGSTAGVAYKGSPSLVNGTTSLTNGSTSLTSGSTALTPGSTPLVKGGSTPLVNSVGPLVYPGKALVVQETPHEVKITLAADVLFDFGRSELRPDAEKTLREAATKTKFAHAKGPIAVDGFTDAKGAAGLNQKLSEARADAVEDWLVRNGGFSASGLRPKGFGAARPVAANTKPDGTDNPAGRQLNRRVEIVVTR
jgi:outer membrane protein OmpA-like peptidoglycan-associated protein